MTPLPWWQRLFAVLFILCFSAATVFLLLRYWNVVHTMSTVASWVEVPVSVSGWEEKSTTPFISFWEGLTAGQRSV